jgi:hypothetical protein
MTEERTPPAAGSQQGSESTSVKVRDRWDKADILLKALLPLVVGGVGWYVTNYFQHWREIDTKHAMYTQLMAEREKAESSLRQGLFSSLIQSFIKKEGSMDIEERLLHLELLAHNFAESLNLKPLFSSLDQQIDCIDPNKSDEDLCKPRDVDPKRADQYRFRLWRVAADIIRKQLLVLEEQANSRVITFRWNKEYGTKSEIEALGSRRYEELTVVDQIAVPNTILPGSTSKPRPVEKYCRLEAVQCRPQAHELLLRLYVVTKQGTGEEAVVDLETSEFWVGFFDFPMIDNVRLKDDLRCAVVLNNFGEDSAKVTLVLFPGYKAGMKEKPYYEEVVNRLKTVSAQRKQENIPVAAPNQ